MKLNINIKKISGKQNEIEQKEMDYPNEIQTVRELLKETVKIMVAEYTGRMKKGETELLSVLSKEQIQDKSVSGKIGFGINYGKKRPDLEKSIQSALECFEDGIVVLFINGEQVEELDVPIVLKEGDELTFVRMVPLAGRMW